MQENRITVMIDVWKQYRENAPAQTLGQCMRSVIKQFQGEEHSVLSKLDGHVAERYFREHYDADFDSHIQFTIAEMAALTLRSIGNGDRAYVKKVGDEGKLIQLHHSLGRWIRNAFELWSGSHTPEYDEHGVDCSPNHPDAISFEVITMLYTLIKTEQKA